jgi:hypothetical protein
MIRHHCHDERTPYQGQVGRPISFLLWLCRPIQIR